MSKRPAASDFSPAEKAFAEAIADDVPHRAELAGRVATASRAARLTPMESQGEATSPELHAIGADVAGPLLAGYIFWLLREARARNLRRLYFVSRDGQVLLCLARRIAQRNALNIELKYLYGSRQAWHLPAMNAANPHSDWVVEKHPHVTPAIVAERTGLAAASVVEELVAAGHGPLNPDTPLTDDAIRRLRQLLQPEQTLGRFLLSEASRRREVVLGYFRQEGLFDDVPWAMVDLGWLGNIQNSMKSILEAGGWRQPVTGFYFGLFRPGSAGNVKVHYFFGPETNDEYKYIAHSAVQVVEMLCSADHGMTTGYAGAANGRYEPVLKGVPDAGHLRKVHAIREGIIQFIERLDLELSSFDEGVFRKGSLAALKVLYASPSRSQAEALGSFQFSRDQTERVVRDLAPALTLPAAVACLVDLARERHPRVTDWVHGSRARSGVVVRSLFAVARAGHALMTWVRARVSSTGGT
ncbi:MAG: hypothetical protein ACXW31_00510 [Thermoanaerobaculia bacterium]